MVYATLFSPHFKSLVSRVILFNFYNLIEKLFFVTTLQSNWQIPTNFSTNVAFSVYFIWGFTDWFLIWESFQCFCLKVSQQRNAEEMQEECDLGTPPPQSAQDRRAVLEPEDPNFPNLLVEFLEAPGLSADRPSAHEERQTRAWTERVLLCSSGCCGDVVELCREVSVCVCVCVCVCAHSPYSCDDLLAWNIGCMSFFPPCEIAGFV